MAGLILPGRFTSQPWHVPSIDTTSPFVKNPIVCEVGGFPIDIVTRQFGTKLSTSESVADRLFGRGTTFVGNTASGHTYGGRPTAALTRITFAAVFDWTSGASNNFPQMAGNYALNAGFILASTSSGGGNIGITKANVVALNTVSITSGEPYFIVTSHEQAGGDYWVLLKNLRTGQVTRTTQTNTSASTGGGGTWAIGRGRSDLNLAWNGTVGMCYIGNNYIPENMGWQWIQNPWQIFQAPSRVFVNAITGGGGGSFVPAWALNSNTTIIGGQIAA